MNPIEFLPSSGAGPSKRAFAGAQNTRLTQDWIAAPTSADAELWSSLRALRNRVRQQVRDNEYAKNALRTIRNNVVGTGVSMQAQVKKRRGGKLDDAVNSAIEAAWQKWCRKEYCHVAGKLAFADIERLAISTVAESGEILIRKVYKTFGGSRVPLSLEVIEPDQLVDVMTFGRNPENGNAIRMGVEVDDWQRPVAYWLYPYHPGDFQFAMTPPPPNRFERVPASEVIHLFISERPGQTRGIPWFHAALMRLNHMRGYEEAEIVAARAAACFMGFIQSPEAEPMTGDGDDPATGEKVTALQAGEIKTLMPGEEFQGYAPTRPNAAMETFMRHMLRSVAAGVGISYETLSRDYSQSNYSSSRLALLDDRDNWKMLQSWLIANLHQAVFEEWLLRAQLAGVLDLKFYTQDPDAYQAVKWSPRGWSWVDPFKEVQAAKLAVRSGFSTQTEVIAQMGGDIEDLVKTRRRELDMAADNKLVFESDPAQVTDKGEVQSTAPIQEGDDAAATAPAGAAAASQADT